MFFLFIISLIKLYLTKIYIIKYLLLYDLKYAYNFEFIYTIFLYKLFLIFKIKWEFFLVFKVDIIYFDILFKNVKRPFTFLSLRYVVQNIRQIKQYLKYIKQSPKF